MTAAGRIDRQFAKVPVSDADGTISHLPRAARAPKRKETPCRPISLWAIYGSQA